jgi:glycosyltransferase involved in cell wall biosynthesis
MSGRGNVREWPTWLQLRMPGYVLQEQIDYAIRMRGNRYDLAHLTANTAPLLRFGWPPTVVTVHDVMYLMTITELAISPSLRQNLGRLYRLLAFHSGTTRVDRLIVDSGHTARELAKRVKTRLPPVSVVYPGVDDRFFRDRDLNLAGRVSANYPFQAGDYFLHPGAVDPRKNTGIVLSAFERYRARGGHHELVVVGLTKANRIALLPVPRPGVHLLPFVTNDDLLMLLQLAHGVIYVPSEEGFGYPLVEAMAAGVPVIMSAISVLEEMSAGCASAVRPRDTDALAAGLLEFDANEGRARDLAARGRVRAKAFTTRRMAEETLTAYQQTLTAVSLGKVSSTPKLRH